MLSIFTIKDIKSGAYNTPFFQPNRECAIRTLSQLTQDTSTLVAQYPEDFQLFSLGKFDPDNGILVAREIPEYVISACDLKLATASGVLRHPSAANEPSGSAQEGAIPLKGDQ